jgi:cytochrome c-type biogenesis protein CcmF
VGPLIAWRKASWDNLRRNFLWPATASIMVGFLLFIWQVRDFLPLLAFTLCAFVIFTIVFDTALAVRARQRIAGEGIAMALVTLTRRNQRRYGGFIVHLGVVFIVLGIAGSMSYSFERQATLNVGEELGIGRYQIQFAGLSGYQRPTHYRVEGTFRVFNEGYEVGLLTPVLRFHPQQDSPIGRAVFRSSPAEDVYLILSGFSALEENQATLKVLVRPLVMWIWIGGFVMALGTMIAVWPLRKSGPRDVSTWQTEERNSA